MPPPVILLLDRLAIARPLGLPGRKVGVLDGERLEGGLPSVTPCLVACREFAMKDAHRPSVEDRMVHEQGNDMLLRRKADNTTPHERPMLESERPLVVRDESRDRVGLPFSGRRPRRVDDDERPGGCLRHAGHDLTFHEGQRRPQRLVPQNDPVQCGAECRDVERSSHDMSVGDRVDRRIRGVLLQKPEPPLCRRGGDHPRPRCQRCAAARTTGWNRRVARRLPERSAWCPSCRESGERGTLEDVANGGLDGQSVARAGHQPHREQRRASQREEVVVATDPVHGQQRLP